MPDLSTFSSVQENFFVDLYIDSNANGSAYFSDYHQDYTIGSTNYNALGSLLGITKTKTEIRASNQSLTVSISGIPSSNLALIQHADLKGSSMTIRRALFNPVTQALLSTTESNPTIKFKGIVNNYSTKETWNADTNSSTFTLTFQVQSVIGQLLTKSAGRRTNPVDEKKFFATDTAFDRVPSLRNSNYNFGAPDFMPRVGTK
tara:strand:- start:25 stop:633 length:609 start_codon:yes stop_codon:yes gene_type:complete